MTVEHPEQGEALSVAPAPAQDGLLYVIGSLGVSLQQSEARYTEVVAMNDAWREENDMLRGHNALLQNEIMRLYSKYEKDKIKDRSQPEPAVSPSA